MSNSGDVHVVVGGQFGSEAKGATAAFLTEYLHGNGQRSISVRIGGPNAGHTVWDDEGREWKLRHIPVGVVRDPDADLVIAAGSEIDHEVLESEVDALEDAGYRVSERLYVDEQATVIDPAHKEQESRLVGKIGSTGKGIGAARAARMMRTASLYDGEFATDTTDLMMDALHHGVHLVVESTQGYGLGLHAGHYPYCTSGNVRAIDGLSQIGISPWAEYVNRVIPWVVMRTRPIRVAGNSGQLRGETTWDELGLEEERTTVTNKVRRVGEWDPVLASQAVIANGGEACMVSMCMVDQMFPETADQTELSHEAEQWLQQVEKELGARIAIIGTGPTTHWWRHNPLA